MSTRVAKKRVVEKIRVVLYLANGTFEKMEDLSETLNLHRADVLAVAVARLHTSELIRLGLTRYRRKRKVSSSPEDNGCPAK